MHDHYYYSAVYSPALHLNTGLDLSTVLTFFSPPLKPWIELSSAPRSSSPPDATLGCGLDIGKLVCYYNYTTQHMHYLATCWIGVGGAGGGGAGLGTDDCAAATGALDYNQYGIQIGMDRYIHTA